MKHVCKVLFFSLFLIGCNSTLERNDSTQYDKGSFNQLTKTDFDRMADYEIKENEIKYLWV